MDTKHSTKPLTQQQVYSIAKLKERDSEYDKMINATVESMKKTNPERYLRAQFIGDTLMDIDTNNFEKGICYKMEGKPVDVGTATLDSKNTDSIVNNILAQINDYDLKIVDLKDFEINALKSVYGDKWKDCFSRL